MKLNTLKNLKKSSREAVSQHCAGQAGELLVCFDFVSRGYPAIINGFPGAPYDVIVDLGRGDIIRVQVKSTAKSKIWGKGELAREIKYDRKSPQVLKKYGRPKYKFGSGSKAGTDRYSKNKIDLFAFVAIDVKTAMYVSAQQITGSNKVFGAKSFVERAESSLDHFLAERVFS